MKQILIGMTSVPFRFDKELRYVIQFFESIDLPFKVILSIPKKYKKNWKYDELDLEWLNDKKFVVLNLIDTDYGPATKLLGCAEYIKANKIEVESIITLDDDIIFQNLQQQLEKLINLHTERPNEIITSFGLKLIHEPFFSGNGIYNVIEDYSHSVAGFLGVLYPYSFFKSKKLFSFMNKLNPLFFDDDDAYFGAVASKLNIKIWSTTPVGGYTILSDKSAVEMEYDGDRRTRESILYNELIKSGVIKI
jgi:hypothetical protein